MSLPSVSVHRILLTFLPALLSFTRSAEAADFRVLVAAEPPWTGSDAFVKAVFDRRVRLNWRLQLLQSHSVEPLLLRVGGSGQATAAQRLVCEAASGGAAGLLAVGGCPFLTELSTLAHSLQLPFIGVPTTLCRMTLRTGFGFTSGHNPSDLIDAGVSVLKKTSSKTAVVYYDSAQDASILEEAENKLTYVGISSLTFSVDSMNSSALADQMHRLVKNKIRHFLVIAFETTVSTILSIASDSKVMQQNYFWVIVDTGLSQQTLLTHAIPNSNIVLVRGGAFGLEQSGSCPATVLDVFPLCDVTTVKIADIRFTDAVEALAKALNDSLSTHRIAVSNVSCLANQNWTWGRTLDNTIGAISDYDTFRGVIAFNSTSRYFVGQDVDVLGTWNERSTESPVMKLSARFGIASRQLSVLASVRGSRVAFPNTFLGFKNQTLVICSPFAPPYNYHLASFPNKTVILGGMVGDMLQILAKKMEFTYITQDSYDSTFGIVTKGVPSGCLAEVVNGTVTLGGGPFAKSVNRASVVEFSSAFFQESIAILVHRPPVPSKLWNLLIPLRSDVWIALGVTILVGSFVGWVLAYFSPFSAWNLGLEYACADEIWFQEYMWSTIGSLLLQGQDFYPFSMSPRTVMAFWWMFSVIILAVYTGDLASDLVVTNEALSIKTLQDLADSDTVTPAVGAGSFTWDLIQAGGRPEYAELARKLITFQGPRGCRELVLNNNAACLIDFTFATLVYNQFCDKVYLGAETFNPFTAGFIWQPDSYFADLFNFNIEKLNEAGVLWKLFLDNANGTTSCSSSNTVPPGAPVNLEGSGACFIIIGCCYVAGLAFLIIELLWVKLAKKSPLDCAIF